MTERNMEKKGEQTAETENGAEDFRPKKDPLSPLLAEYVRQKSYRRALGLPDARAERYRLLAQGEYNRNYWFIHPVTGKKLVFRINFASQMHLEHQIEYEARALSLIHSSGRTPKVFYTDGSKKQFPYGLMVMEYLPGKPLDYGTQLPAAAGCLADIHSVRLPENHGLAAPPYPLRAILEECREMANVYLSSSLAPEGKKKKLKKLLEAGFTKTDVKAEPPVRCCINTELNSGNFLAEETEGKEESVFLVDWEKPLYADPAQDLGHFLAPTTTFWKTDVILEKGEMEAFISEYIRRIEGRLDMDGIRERTWTYIPVTCLRGITWCAMAWVQYRQPGKEIVNPFTMKKLDEYLDDGFLEQIERLAGWNR